MFQLFWNLFPVFEKVLDLQKFTIAVMHFSGLPPVKSGSCPCFTAGCLYCFVTYQLGHKDFLSNHLAKQRFEISRHEPFYGHCKEVADVLQVLILGDSSKYPYHTTGGILEFRGRGGGVSLVWNSKGMGGNIVWNSKGMGGGVSALNSVNFQWEDGESFA